MCVCFGNTKILHFPPSVKHLNPTLRPLNINIFKNNTC